MRLLICFLSLLPLLASAQSPLDYTAIENARQLPFGRFSMPGAHKDLGKNWQLSSFVGLSGGYSFFNRPNAFAISAPAIVQLTHRLNKNFYAFAAITAAPAYPNFNASFLYTQPGHFSSPHMLTGLNQFGWYSRAEAGLFYINDEKTFSISGSISVDRSSYPVYYPYSTPRKQNTSR